MSNATRAAAAKASPGAHRNPTPTDEQLQALLDRAGPVDPAVQAAFDASVANAIESAPGADPIAVARALRARRLRGPQKAPTKVQIALRIEPDTLARWKATGKGWQSRMSDVLARGPA